MRYFCKLWAWPRAKTLIHLACKTQITLIITEEVTIPDEYLDFSNVF